jgi:hypothetical protein
MANARFIKGTSELPYPSDWPISPKWVFGGSGTRLPFFWTSGAPEGPVGKKGPFPLSFRIPILIIMGVLSSIFHKLREII